MKAAAARCPKFRDTPELLTPTRVLRASKMTEVQNMKRGSSMLALAVLALIGWLGVGIGGASAQTIYVEPVLEPYPVIVAPPYIVRRPAIAPLPIVRERTIVMTRPAYVPAPLIGPPMPPYVVAGC